MHLHFVDIIKLYRQNNCVEMDQFSRHEMTSLNELLLRRNCTLRKLYFHSHWMGYDRGDSFPFDFEPNGFPFGLNRKENCHHYHTPFNVKGK